MVEYPSKGRGLFEERLGLPEAANLHPKPALIPSLECSPEYTKPLLVCATLLRDTPHSESTPRLLSQEDRAKAKQPLGLVISPLLPHFCPNARDKTPCLTRNYLIWDRVALLGS